MMKKLNRPPEPEQLRTEKEELTRKYCNGSVKSPVWRRPYIIELLFESSFGTCAYCGCKIVKPKSLSEKSKEIELNKEAVNFDDKYIPANENNFMHIDHFVPKKIDCKKVVEWSNLIPSCPVCNIEKGDHDVTKDPVINPYDEDPRCYFFIEGNSIRIKNISLEKTKKALRTMVVFDLNHRIIKQTYDIWINVNCFMDKFFKEVEESIDAMKCNDRTKINVFIREFRELLNKGTPRADYGALVATLILKHQAFEYIKQVLVGHNLWYAKFVELENQLKEIAYV